MLPDLSNDIDFPAAACTGGDFDRSFILYIE
jgi:hypothetical protein